MHGSEAFVMLEHFMGENGHGVNSMMVKPIEMIQDPKLLNKREDYWIAELNTVFPYGLNMDASFGGIKNAYTYVTEFQAGKAVYTLFNSVKSSRSKRGKKRSNSNNGENAMAFNCKVWINDFVSKTLNESNMIHSLRTEIFKLCKADLKCLFLDNAKKTMSGNLTVHPNHQYFHYIIRDLCLHKLQKLYVKPSGAFITIKHANKLVDDINLSRIVSDKHVQSLFPTNSVFYIKPGVSFSYIKSIRSEIVNYRQTIEDPNYHQFQCNCDNYPERFKDDHHGHIYTGNMDIVNHNELRNIMIKGFGFHDQQAPNKTVAYNSVVSGVDSYIYKVSNKLGVPLASFTGWKREVLNRVKFSLDKCKKYKFNNVLSKPWVQRELSKLKEDFVLVPVDKAGKNISIICKKYYIEVMANEVLNSDTLEDVSNDKTHFLSNLQIQSPGKLDNDKLPYLYATTKMHKNPTNFRYITAARDTAFSSISINVSKCLKLLMNTARKSVSYQIKEIDNCIFVIDNRDRIINCINMCNQKKNNYKQISTWDFSTLYTKIPHQKLKDKVSTFVRKVYKCVKHSSKAANYISCSDKSRTAYWSKSSSKSNISLSADQLIVLVNIIIDNSYILFHDNVFRQIIGIPMGTNCAPYLANIFLHAYEYEYLVKLVEQGNTVTARKLAQLFRYQDDCAAFNDNGMFKEHYKHIYPPEMVLECTNLSNATCTFLDLRISVFRGKFRYKSYDKRKEFNFSIANYPHMNGNIPYSTSYGVYTSQLVRYCDINLEIKSFVADVKDMTDKFICQGFITDMLKNTFRKFRDKYLYKWSKFGVDISDFCASLFTC